MVAGSDIVAYARTQLGDPYRWGAEGPDAFDCSGLVQYVYKHFGISTPRTTFDMVRSDRLQPISRADLRPGDLVFSNWIGKPSSHVAIYAGNGQVIEAPTEGEDVKVTKLGPGYWSHADAYRRVKGVDGSTSGSSGTSSTSSDVLDALAGSGALGPAGSLLQLIPNPGNVTAALTNIGTAMAGVAGSAAQMGEFATLAGRAFLPSNIMRGAFLSAGVICLLIGVWFLAREVKD